MLDGAARASPFDQQCNWIREIRLEPLRLFVSDMVKLDWKDGVAGCGGSCFSCLTRTWIGSIVEVDGARQGQRLHAGVPSWGERSCSASLGIILPRTTTRTLPRLASGDASSTLVCGSDSIGRQMPAPGKLSAPKPAKTTMWPFSTGRFLWPYASRIIMKNNLKIKNWDLQCYVE